MAEEYVATQKRIEELFEQSKKCDDPIDAALLLNLCNWLQFVDIDGLEPHQLCNMKENR